MNLEVSCQVASLKGVTYHVGDQNGNPLQSHALLSLAKDLAPPGVIGLSLKYRQLVPGLSESHAGPPR